MNLPNLINYRTYVGEPLPHPSLYDYILHRDGVTKRAVSPYFTAALPVSNGATIAGLKPYDEPCFEMLTPRIWSHWLRGVLGHARQVCSSDIVAKPVEQMYHFHYIRGTWRVATPPQEANGSRVAYRGGDEATVVLDLHSHHEMGAFFSETDDADEQGLRLYGVIGRIWDRPEIRVRVGVYGDWLELDPLLVFDGLGPFVGGYDGSARIAT